MGKPPPSPLHLSTFHPSLGLVLLVLVDILARDTVGAFNHEANGSRYTLNVWDVGGQRTLRPYWRNYFESTDAVVWVVDSSDRLRVTDCKDELRTLLQEEVSPPPSSCLFHFSAACLFPLSPINAVRKWVSELMLTDVRRDFLALLYSYLPINRI